MAFGIATSAGTERGGLGREDSGLQSRVLFDVAHHNYHRPEGRFRPFVELIEPHGFSIESNRQSFETADLDTTDILIIVNASGALEGAALPEERRPDFTWAERQRVSEWVRSGGSLLLVADHGPSGASARILAERPGVEMSDGYVVDEAHGEPGYGATTSRSRARPARWRNTRSPWA